MESLPDDEISLDIKEVAQHLLKARELMTPYSYYSSSFILIRVIFNPNEESGITAEDRMSSFGFFRITVNTKRATFKNVNKVKRIFLKVGMELHEDTEWKKRYSGEDAYIAKLTHRDHREIWQAIEETTKK